MIFHVALRRARNPRPGVVSGLGLRPVRPAREEVPGMVAYVDYGRGFVTTAHHRALRMRRHRLMIAAVDDRWYTPWRRASRLRTIARTEAELNATGIPW